MVDNTVITTIEEDNEQNVRVYKTNGSIVRVKREFEKGGSNILEQVIYLLLNYMDIEESKKGEIKETIN